MLSPSGYFNSIEKNILTIGYDGRWLLITQTLLLFV